MSDASRLAPADIIDRKAHGGALSSDEIRTVIDGVVAPDGDPARLDDSRVIDFLKAVFAHGMTPDETIALTLAMRDSGRVLDLDAIDGPTVDKHSTGGVGDKVSLVLAPLVAAAGVAVPMISGRGLEHTGGTLDKLESIPGFRVDLAADELVAAVRDVGWAIAGATADLAPADRRLYALRDVTGTVASLPLIVGSILSKKLAAGVDGLVMDVKVGRGAFMKVLDAARVLRDSLVEVGSGAGLRMRALLTDMDAPLGRAVGGGLEVREAIEALRGAGPHDLMEVVMALGSEMLVLGNGAEDRTVARESLHQVLASGAALEGFAKGVERQGGDPRVTEDPSSVLAAAPIVRPVHATTSGFITDIDPLAIGRATVALGGGRRRFGDLIDPRVGVVLLRTVGESVSEGEPWAEIHAGEDDAAAQGAQIVAGGIRIGMESPLRRRVIE